MKTYKQAVLILHDFSNLSFQVLQYESEDCNKTALKEIADNLNQCFALAGTLKQFQAQVNIEEIEDIAESESQAETGPSVDVTDYAELERRTNLRRNQIRGVMNQGDDDL